MRTVIVAMLLVLLVPAFAAAQQPAGPYDQAMRASAALQVAAAQALAPAVDRPVVAEDALAPRRRGKKAEGVTLMLIGGGAVVVGAIAGGGGGAVLIVGGVICAGYGFYLYTE